MRTQPSVPDSILDLASFVPAFPRPRIGVGVRGAGELWPILIGGGMTAAQLFLGVMLSTVLYSQFRGKGEPASETLGRSLTGNTSWLSGVSRG